MNKKELPIDKITDKEFLKFKKKFLDKNSLSEEALEQIGHFFGIDCLNAMRLYCKKNHQHEYSCLKFYDFRTAVVERLLVEIKLYKKKLYEIDKWMHESINIRS